MSRCWQPHGVDGSVEVACGELAADVGGDRGVDRLLWQRAHSDAFQHGRQREPSRVWVSCLPQSMQATTFFRARRFPLKLAARHSGEHIVWYFVERLKG